MREDDNEQFAFGGGCGFFLGVFIMVLIMVFVVSQDRWAARQQAIDHGAARYNSTSGEFEWIEKAEKTE